jgi:hypothetical protein
MNGNCNCGKHLNTPPDLGSGYGLYGILHERPLQNHEQWRRTPECIVTTRVTPAENALIEQWRMWAMRQ